MYDLFQVSTTPIQFRTWTDVLPEKEKPAVCATLDRYITERRPEFQLIHPCLVNGRRHWIKKHGRYVYHPDGTLRYMCGTCQDITKDHNEDESRTKTHQYFSYQFTCDDTVRDHITKMSGFLGRHPILRPLYQDVARVAATNATVLLRGETGTGKDLLAHALHTLSPRSSQPFTPINCASITRDLFESELFGHVKGAFTGATQTKKGLFATKGTVFLDELGCLPLDLQTKLLRAVEYGFRPVGSTQEQPLTCRILCAVNQDLRDLVEQGTFREDLYFRLAVAVLNIPPLRDHREDIPYLILNFWQEFGMTDPIPEDLVLQWTNGFWPGNVRELKHAVEQYAIFRRWPMSEPARQTYLADCLRTYEQQIIRATLRATQHNKRLTAKRLGITERTLYRKLAEN